MCIDCRRAHTEYYNLPSQVVCLCVSCVCVWTRGYRVQNIPWRLRALFCSSHGNQGGVKREGSGAREGGWTFCLSYYTTIQISFLNARGVTLRHCQSTTDTLISRTEWSKANNVLLSFSSSFGAHCLMQWCQHCDCFFCFFKFYTNKA